MKHEQLPSSESEPAAASGGPRLLLNFVLVSCCFSLNHGCVSALLALATSELGTRLGNLQNALLYGVYTGVALLLAGPIVRWLGLKASLVSGLWLYVVYVGSFLLADQVPDARWPAACFGGCMGGLAAGFLWTAQGAYMVRNAELYAAAGGVDRQRAVVLFAAVFAGIFLGLEVACKVMQSYIGVESGPASAHWSGGKEFIYVINTILAAAAALASVWILPMSPREEEQHQTTTDRLLAASALFVTDPKMPTMAFIQVAFATSAAYINSYVTPVVLPYYLGGGYGGYLSAVTSASAALVSLPLGQVQSARAHAGGMLVGQLSFGLVTLLPLAAGYDDLGGWGGLVLLYCLQGVGRGVWEGVNKAVYAEYFSDSVAAFANVTAQNGLASTICFLINTYGEVVPGTGDCSCSDPAEYVAGSEGGCDRGSCPAYSGLAWANTIMAVAAAVGFVAASLMHGRGVSRWDQMVDEDAGRHASLSLTTAKPGGGLASNLDAYNDPDIGYGTRCY